MENTNKNAVYDIPDDRDYRYELVFGVQGNYPKKYLMDKGIYQNQGLEKITKYMCVFYSTAHGNNEQNIIEGSETRIDGKVFGLLAEEKKLLNTKSGTLLKNGPAFAKTLKYTSGYSLVLELNEIKDSLVNNRPIVVGTNKANWSKTKKIPFILQKGTSYGHAFVIIGFDDDYNGGCLICKNSYGKDYQDNGKFYIKYSEFKEILFYSKYSLIDEIDPIIKYKKNIMDNINIPMAKVGFELGIWNGKNATKSMSREEVVTVVLKAIEKFKKGEISEERIGELLDEVF